MWDSGDNPHVLPFVPPAQKSFSFELKRLLLYRYRYLINPEGCSFTIRPLVFENEDTIHPLSCFDQPPQCLDQSSPRHWCLLGNPFISVLVFVIDHLYYFKLGRLLFPRLYKPLTASTWLLRNLCHFMIPLTIL